jgi:hypothetical protein
MGLQCTSLAKSTPKTVGQKPKMMDSQKVTRRYLFEIMTNSEK